MRWSEAHGPDRRTKARAAGFAPPRRLADVGPAGSWAAIAKFLDDGSRRRHWQDVFDRLSPGQREAASRVLLMIALHRRIAARDFEAVLALLDISIRLGIADTPATSQAAELLDRLSLLPLGASASNELT